VRHGLTRLVSATTLAGIVLLAPFAYAQAIRPESLPGASDAGRFRPEERLPQAPKGLPSESVQPEQLVPPVAIPKGAENVRFVLKSVKLTGMTVFTPKEFNDFYAPLLNHEVTLKQIYALAAQITLSYRNAGYLLSYAYVPDQEISSGNVTIAVAEGYVGRVHVEGDDPNAAITKKYIRRITQQKPLQNKTLESVLLRLNDLPGRSYRAVLAKEPTQNPGEAILNLVPARKKHRASVGFDNFSSRYLGPNEVSASVSDSVLPRQQTSLFGLTSLPTDKLNYAMVNHSWVAAPDITMDGTVSTTRSKPGYTLKALDIDSTSNDFQLGVNYQWVRQRTENLLVKIQAKARNVRSDLANNTPLTRDDVRTLIASASYDIADGWGGSNVINTVFTQGIDGLGASKRGARNLSRSQAKPDFSKLELTYSRIQALSSAWATTFQMAGQKASGPLYASEEFGVGGQAYGRAFDSSEIVGDDGVSGSLELRYTALRTMQPVNLEPYLYYDTGYVTNRDVGQSKRDYLASVGGGVRFASLKGQSGMLGLAFPLSRSVNAPIYGQSKVGPRVLLQISQSF
jgi:hemolysin activation/secretion protein